MSDLTKKRVRWKEYNGEELTHDEDVDVLTSADSVTFSDNETIQYKYTQGQFVNPSVTGVLENLSTINKSSLVDAVNEVKSDFASSTTSINSLTTRMTTAESNIDNAESDIDSLETRMTTAESDIDSLETRMTTAESDIDNLETRNKTYTATLSKTWEGSTAPYTQTIAVNGMLLTDIPIIDVSLSSTTSTAIEQLNAWGCVSTIVTGTNSITATCLEDKPEVDIPIIIKVVK